MEPPGSFLQNPKPMTKYVRSPFRYPAEYGFLWNHEHKGYTVPFRGLPAPPSTRKPSPGTGALYEPNNKGFPLG